MAKVEFSGVDGKTYSISPVHMQFVETYLSNGYNATQAYMDVFKNKNRATSNSAAVVVMKRPDVKAYLTKASRERFESLHITAERIIEELAKVGFVPVESDKVAPQVKVQALDKLSKIYGLYEQKKEEAPQQIHIKIEE